MTWDKLCDVMWSVMWCDVWCVIICVECTLHSPVLILRLRSGHPQPPTASDSGVASALGRSPYLTLQTSALLSIGILLPVTVLIHRSSVTVSVYVCVYVLLSLWSLISKGKTGHHSKYVSKVIFVVFRVEPSWAQTQSRGRSISLRRGRRSWRSASLSTIPRLGKY